MFDDQQGDRPGSHRRVQVRIATEEEPGLITVIPPTPITPITPITPVTYSSSNSSVDSLDKVELNNFDSGIEGIRTGPPNSIRFWRRESFPPTLRWIPTNCTWSKWKPVLRSALAAWISLLLFVTPKTLDAMGQQAFLIIIASFLSPPSGPFIVLLQRELGILAFTLSGWAWSCLGIKLANLARSNIVPHASPASIRAGDYIELVPSSIMAIFLFIGTFFFLYVKSRISSTVPAQVIFAYFFSSMLCMDMSLTISAMYPYPYYRIGRQIVLPFMFHSAVSLILSLCFFPTSGSATFTRHLQGVLSSLVSATKEHRQRLQQDVTAFDFSPSSIDAAINKAEGAVAGLSSAARLQKFDIIYSRFSPTDPSKLHTLTKGLIVKARGMSVYYTLIDPTRERFPITPVPSIPTTPALASPYSSRPPSPTRDRSPEKWNDQASFDSGIKRHPFLRYHSATSSLHLPHAHPRKRRHFHLKQSSSQSSLLHLALSRATTRTESAVGVFESIHYLNLEATHLHNPEAHVARANELLSDSCQDLLKSCEHGLQGACDWLGSVRSNIFNVWLGREDKKLSREDRIKKFEDLDRELSFNLDEFTNKRRFTVVDPYRSLFVSTDDTSTESETPSHRHLFHCYVYQYHLMRFATSVQEVLREIIRLEIERDEPKIWIPTIRWSRTWAPSDTSQMLELDDDEDPDMILGMEPSSLPDLGEAVRRDPDALPPRNTMERIGNWMYLAAKEIGGGHVLFALKAAILTIILSTPSYLRTSAEFAYENKFVWPVIMSQLTIARFRGDTVFGLLTRILSTLVGGAIGLVTWYISTGHGQGNAIGLAAVCFFFFPLFFFFRLYWPVAPMTNLITWVTTAMIIGYSWQDTHLPSPSSPGYGFNVAWRRFVLVTIGVVSAGITSYFPPSTTIRLYERKTLATATEETGAIYCSIISYANTKREGETAVIVNHLLAILGKLKRSIVLKDHAAYELSLRGKWPAKRYQRILELQIQIVNLLSHLTSVLEQMEPAWTQAFLQRTRLSDADFQGDVLAVMSLISSALRTGKPLPQVTPCPLLHRFMEHRQGLNVVDAEAEDDYGLPKVLTEKTLESLQYMNFCVGVSTAFGIITRLDKLMVAVKELVGEQYHIHGVGLPLHYRRGRGLDLRTPVQSLT